LSKGETECENINFDESAVINQTKQLLGILSMSITTPKRLQGCVCEKYDIVIFLKPS